MMQEQNFLIAIQAYVEVQFLEVKDPKAQLLMWVFSNHYLIIKVLTNIVIVILMLKSALEII